MIAAPRYSATAADCVGKVVMRIFFAASLVPCLACGGNSLPGSPSSPAASEPVTYVVSGVVSEFVGGVPRPVANHSLWLFIQETEGLPAGILLRGSSQAAATDQSGRYFARVPRSRVFVSAVWGKQQPCVASASVIRDTTIDVETVAPGGAAVPLSTPSPLITGFVFESTAQGRKPIAGASAWLDLSSDAYIASTESDETGHFYFCRANARARIDVSVNGYQPYQRSEFISGSSDASFEFEFNR